MRNGENTRLLCSTFLASNREAHPQLFAALTVSVEAIAKHFFFVSICAALRPCKRVPDFRSSSVVVGFCVMRFEALPKNDWVQTATLIHEA